jgi:hypothetical protein
MCSAYSNAGVGTCGGVNAGESAVLNVTTRKLEASLCAQRGTAAGSHVQWILIGFSADVAMASCLSIWSCGLC